MSLLAPQHVAPFVEAGNATFTVENTRTGGRFTYKVVAPKNEGAARFFVSLLNGPDNTADYVYIGSVYKDGGFAGTRKGPVSPEAPSVRGFDWIWRHRAELPEYVRVFHMGRCACCGRALTTPESVERGIGPFCAGKRAAA